MSIDPRLARDPRLSIPQPPPPPAPPPVEEDGTSHSISQEASENTNEQDDASEESNFKLKFCTVCASNQNRSMEGHLRLALAKYPVISFGTGSLVRLPGPTISQPNVYPFNVTSYDTIYNELSEKDPRLYRQNGVLNMIGRNRTIKYGPERWQDWAIGKPRLDRYTQDKGSKGTEGGVVDVVITCEERCWDSVVDNLLERGSPLNRPVHIINVDIRDNHEEALIGGKAILNLAESLNEAAKEERERSGVDGWANGAGPARESFDEKVPEVIAEWQERYPNFAALWTLAWF